MNNNQLPGTLCKIEFRFLRVKPNEKIPKDSNWQSPGLMYDSAEIQSHIRAGGNVGIIGGYGRLRLLDIDKPELAEQISKVLKTFTVQSGKGGRHFYILSDYDQNHVLGGGQGELRAKMQYVLCPPSIHPNGTPYRIVNDAPIINITGEGLSQLLEPFFKLSKTDYNKILTGNAEPGERNDGFFRTACLMRFNRIPKEQAAEIIKEANARTEKPLQDAELNRVIENAYKYQGQRQEEDASFEILNKIQSLQCILENPIKPIFWRVQDIIPKSGVSIWGGVAGSYKTWAAMHAACCIAGGKPFLDLYETEPGSVLFFDEESGDITLPFRFNALSEGMGRPDLSSCYISIFNNLSLDSIGKFDLLQEAILKFNPSVIIIDSLVRAMSGLENEADSVRRIFDNIKKYLKDDRSFIILHHLTKNTNNGLHSLRGSGDLGAFCDVVLLFRPGLNGFCYVEVAKNRHVMITDDNRQLCFQVVNEGSAVRLESRTVNQSETAVQRATDLLIQWITTEKLTSFQTRPAMEMLGSNSISERDAARGIKRLVEVGSISKIKRGIYTVNHSKLLTVEYEDV